VLLLEILKVINLLKMKKKILIGVAIVVIILLAVFLNYNQKPNTQGLKVGAIMSLTGDFGAVGENTLKGMKVAQGIYKEKTGNQVDLVVEDDGGDGAKGLSAYRKLTTQDNVGGLINFFTTTMDSIYEPSKSANFPIMMVAFQANNVADDQVFQMTQGNDNVWDRFSTYIKGAGFNESKVVVVHSIDAAQDSFAKAFVKEYDKPATTIVASSDKNALRSDAAKIAALKPTTIVFIMTPENGAILTKELLPLIDASTQLVYDIQLTTGTSYYETQLGNGLSRINGAIALGMEGDLNSSEYKEFYNAYKKMYPNEEPGFLADYGYDTFMTYVNSYNIDKSNWISNLKDTDTKGASGVVKFDKNGIRIPPLVIKKVTDGKLQTVSRLPL
jgi:ABC-type branched-subunit amino acid transport system substrate-binding protein